MDNQQKCSKCKIFKNFDLFNKSKNQPNGLHRVCKTCRIQERQDSKEHIKQKQKEYYENNKETLLKKNADYRSKNIDFINSQRKEYRNRPEIKIHISNKNIEYLPIRKESIKERRKIDKNFQLTEIIRSKYHKMIRGHETSYKNIIGCTVETLKEWLEFQFDDKMNWENQGSYWHIDHILPINQFNFENENEIHICFNWTNLQPLQKNENIKKSDKILLHYYMNSIVNIHRFSNKTKSNFEGYQRVNESLLWLREKTQVW
jgi:hypothetical protein